MNSQHRTILFSFEGGGSNVCFAAGFMQTLFRSGFMIGQRSLWTGTSAGAILARACAHGHGPDVIAKATMIVAEAWSQRAQAMSRMAVGVLGPSLLMSAFAGIFTPRYSNEPLRLALTSLFGTDPWDDPLKDPAFCIYVQASSVPHAVLLGKGETSLTAVDACLRSTAAPGFLPPMRDAEGGTYFDGGIMANDPTLHTLAALAREGGDLTRLTVLRVVQADRGRVAGGGGGLVGLLPLIGNAILTASAELADLVMQTPLITRGHTIVAPTRVALDETDPDTLAALSAAGVAAAKTFLEREALQ